MMKQEQHPSLASKSALTSLLHYCGDFLEAAGRHSLGSLHFRQNAARRGYLDVALLTCDEQLLFQKAGSIIVDENRTGAASMPDVGIAFDDSETSRDEMESRTGIELGAFELMRRIHGMVRSNPYEFECTYGALFLEGKTPAGADVFLPLLSTPVAISYDETGNRFLLEAGQDYANLNVHAISRVMPLYYKQIKDRLLEHVRLPIPIDVDELFKVLHLLRGDGQFVSLPREIEAAPSFVQIIEYQTANPSPLPRGQYRVSRAAGIAVMRRGSTFALQDLHTMQEMDPAELEQSLLNKLVHAPSTRSRTAGGLSSSLMGDGEVLFPFSTNQQQIDVAYAIENNDLVVVEGPPGTGKSQTLANLAVHLAARGRRVLLVSEQPKAVDVASEKYISTLGVPFLPMTVHRKDGEILSGLRDRLSHLKKLAKEQSPELARQSAVEAELEVERLRVRLMQLHREFQTSVEFDTTPWKDTGLAPGQLACEYAEARDHDVNPSSEPVQWNEQEELVEQLLLARRTASGALGSIDYQTITTDLARIVTLLSLADHAMSGMGDAPLSELSYYDAIAHPEHTPGPDLAAIIRNQLHKARRTSPQVQLHQSQLDALHTVRHLDRETCRQDLAAVEDLQALYRCYSRLGENEPSRLIDDAAAELTETTAILSKGKANFSVLQRQRDCLRDSIRLQSTKLRTYGIRDERHETTGLATEVLLETVRGALVDRMEALAHCSALGGLVEIEDLVEIERLERIDDTIRRIRSATAAPRCHAEVDKIVDGWKLSDQPDPLLDRAATAARQRDIPGIANIIEEIQARRAEDQHALQALLTGPLVRWQETVRRWLPLDDEPAVGDIREALKASVRAAALRTELEAIKKAAPRQAVEITDSAARVESAARKLAGTAIAASFSARVLGAYANPDRRADLESLLASLESEEPRPFTLSDLKQSTDRFASLLDVFPCWVATLQDTARFFPLQPGLFDIVLIDEASQCSIPSAMPLLMRAKKAIVVGDEKQLLSVESGLVDQYRNQALINWHHLADAVSNLADFDARTKSMFNLAETFADATVSLTEHFRSHFDIISFSNSRFYDSRLSILTKGIGIELGPPTILRVIDDAIEGRETNPTEAEAVIAELRRLVDHPRYAGLDFAVCSPFRRQAELIWDIMCDEFSDSEVLHRNLVSATPDGLQGDERDVILHSFVYAPNSHPEILSITQDRVGQQRMNVALTRARRQSYYFVSAPPQTLPPGLVKDILCEIERGPAEMAGNSSTSGSQFHKHLAETFQTFGLEVTSFARVGDYIVDFVVQDAAGRTAAVEADDWLPRSEEAMGQQRLRSLVDTNLRRAGWRIFRMSAIRFYLEPEIALQPLVSYFELSANTDDSVTALQQRLGTDGRPPLRLETRSAYDVPDAFERSLRARAGS